MHTTVTAWPNIAHSDARQSEFSSALSEHHHQLSEGLEKCLHVTKPQGIKLCGPKSFALDDPPDSNSPEPAPLPDAVGEFNVDISQPKLISLTDASHSSELGERRSIAGCVLTVLGVATACESKTQTVAAPISAKASAKAEFVAAFTAAEAAWCLRFIPQELGFPQEGPTEIHIGNQAASQITNDNQAPTIRAKHSDVRFLGLQDWREEGSTSTAHAAGVLIPSGDLTKPLAHCLHARHCRRMMGRFN